MPPPLRAGLSHLSSRAFKLLLENQQGLFLGFVCGRWCWLPKEEGRENARPACGKSHIVQPLPPDRGSGKAHLLPEVGEEWEPCQALPARRQTLRLKIQPPPRGTGQQKSASMVLGAQARVEDSIATQSALSSRVSLVNALIQSQGIMTLCPWWVTASVFPPREAPATGPRGRCGGLSSSE